jgi:hypothetical protein
MRKLVSWSLWNNIVYASCFIMFGTYFRKYKIRSFVMFDDIQLGVCAGTNNYVRMADVGVED